MGKFSRIFTLGTSAAVMALAMPAMAQDAGEDEDRRDGAVQRVLGPVTVTATKKADVENVQDVPIAVTAFNADTLDALNVNTLEDLGFSTPNVSLDDIGTSRGTANFSIRGLGVNSSIPSIDPAVGVFIDGVYLGVNNGVIIDLFDLESVEILRGPQGLLFGRNPTGGALVVNTVARAQAAWLATQQKPAFAAAEVTCFHARFPVAARMVTERQLQEQFGRAGGNRP